eukprot:TRINITY_DN32098_c0_g1_i4.p1 TRINITY_DN32098_c0_g1~~TRINITY_DN32098_c0_g1_i4.p1  ORF type:complete len:1031 (+),score=348.41 TRINITY_DN32098_c0_g1_i4:513-3605(+)
MVGFFDGRVSIVNFKELSVLSTMKPSNEWISQIKCTRGISDDTETVAVASHDCRVYLFSLQANGECVKKAVCRGHSSYITNIDFSADGKNLQSTCGAYEILFWDVSTGRQIKRSSSLADTQWGSWTCTLGWPIQGIFRGSMDGTDFNSADRSHDSKLLALADDFGSVRLLNYPCISDGACFAEFKGHSSHVTNVRFIYNDNYLISLGGHDKTIFQWKCCGSEDGEVKELSNEDCELDSDIEDDYDERRKQKDDGIMSKFDKVLGDEFMAVKPWLGAIVAPSDYKAGPPQDAPDAEMELEWVHGYRSWDARNNAHYTCSGSIIYPAAGVCISYAPVPHTQEYMMSHSDDVTCLALHPSGRIAASGEIGAKPRLVIWNCETMETCATFKGHRRNIVCLSFSESGDMVMSVGHDDDFTLMVHDWNNEALVGKTKTSKKKVLDCSFGASMMCTCGVNHVNFWRIKDGALSRVRGLFGKVPVQTAICCVMISDTLAVTGMARGQIYIWRFTRSQRFAVAKVIQAHSAAVNCMTYDGNYLFSGSKDGVAKTWKMGRGGLTTASEDIDLKTVDIPAVLDCKKAQEKDAFSIRSISSRNGRLLIGNRSSQLLELDVHKNLNVKVEGHYRNELWGLCNVGEDKMITAGDDKSVRLWDTKSRKCIAAQFIGFEGRTSTASHDGETICVGSTEGQVLLLNASTLEITSQKQISRQWISDVRYSPDGSKIAIGSHDCMVYIADASTLEVISKCKGHSSYITHVDFSSDGEYLQSTCGAYELLFWKTADGKQITRASSLRDVQWHTWTCTLGWPVQGIWQDRMDGTDINAVDRSKNQKLLVTADDRGKVSLLKYPCVEKNAPRKSFDGHSSHVTCARWLTDEIIVSVGGADRSIFQWRVQCERIYEEEESQMEVGEDGIPIMNSDDDEDWLMEPSDDEFSEFSPALPIMDDEPPTSKKSHPSKNPEMDPFAMLVMGDEFMAVKPWKAACVEPSDWNESETPTGEPQERLDLQWVYGVRCEGVRNHVRLVLLLFLNCPIEDVIP